MRNLIARALQKRRASGMTLPEVMITLVIFSTLMAPMLLMVQDTRTKTKNTEPDLQKFFLLKSLEAEIDPWNPNFTVNYTIGCDANGVNPSRSNTERCQYLTRAVNPESSRGDRIYYRQTATNTNGERRVFLSTFRDAASTGEPNVVADYMAAPDVTPDELYINVGSTQDYVDGFGHVWRRDRRYNPTPVFSEDSNAYGWVPNGNAPNTSANLNTGTITGTNDSTIFTTYRTSLNSPSVLDDATSGQNNRMELLYRVRMRTEPAARYLVEVYTLEPTGGNRSFRVYVNQTPMVIDPEGNGTLLTPRRPYKSSSANATDAAAVFSTVTTTSDGWITIGFDQAGSSTSPTVGPVVCGLHVKKVN